MSATTITQEDKTILPAGRRTEFRQLLKRRSDPDKSRVMNMPILFAVLVSAADIIVAGILGAVFGLEGVIADLIVTTLPVILIALTAKIRFRNNFKLGFGPEGMGEALRCSSIVIFGALLIFAYNLIAGTEMAFTPRTIIVSICTGIGAGVSEEVLYRGLLCNDMMLAWHDKKNGIYLSAVVSSLFFGAMHMTNAFYTGFTLGLMIQVILAVSMGFLFAAIYLRSGNLWGVILAHTIWDIAGLVITSGTAANSVEAIISNVNNVTAASAVLNLGVAMISIMTGLYLLRPCRHDSVRERWNAA